MPHAARDPFAAEFGQGPALGLAAGATPAAPSVAAGGLGRVRLCRRSGAFFFGSRRGVASRVGRGGRTLTSMRELLGAVAAASGLRVTDVVIEGRANTPEAVLREAIGINKG